MNMIFDYALQDFIAYSGETYLALLAQVNYSYWPLQIVAITASFLALVLAYGRGKCWSLVLLSSFWFLLGVVFYQEFYSQLNWAWRAFYWLATSQGLLLCFLALVGRTHEGCGKVQHVLGVVLSLFGLLFLPLLSWLLSEPRSLAFTQLAGIHPFPTAVVSLGIVLIAVSGFKLWVLTPIPLMIVFVNILRWSAFI